MKISSKGVLKILIVLSWVLFIGLCIEAGGCLFSAFYTLVINPNNAAHFWAGNDLSGLYRYSPGHFSALALLISIASTLKACMFYLIVMILHEKKLNMVKPFSLEVRTFITRISWLAMGIGLFSLCGARYTAWLVQQGLEMPDTQYLHLGGPDVWLFMSVILFAIGQIFKRGIDIQTENDLTV